MESIVAWFANTLGQYVSAQMVIFIVSMMPVLECRGGLLVASLLQVPIAQAIPLCIVGNILPMPFILLFIKRIFTWCKEHRLFYYFITKIENRALAKSEEVKKGEFIGLLLFVGVPLPGTGAWTGSLLASLLDIELRKATLAIFLGVLLATFLMAVLSYGFLANFVY